MNTKTDDIYDLARFINAQSLFYKDALAEITAGRKETHWMWYVYPQLKELGFSENAHYYGISSLKEAQAYVENPILGPRLHEITEVLLKHETNNPEEIFGWPDNMKLKSCMTLFEIADLGFSAYALVLEKYFRGQRDEKTIKILRDRGEIL